MNPLHTEFVRLYHANPQHALPLHDATRSPLLGADGHVRCAVLELARPADWSVLGPLWRSVQTDLDLPAPAIAINGLDGYQLWFGWQEGIGADLADSFLRSLIARYLSDTPAARLRCWPDPDAISDSQDPVFPGNIPALHPRSGQWSAFIAPDLAAVFTDEPWLDRDPGQEAQAQLLGRLQGMSPQAFAKAMEVLQPIVATPQRSPESTGQRNASTAYPSATAAEFLQAVMQDPQAPLALRVQAAAALLGPGSCRS
jgi:hypothetical protein